MRRPTLNLIVDAVAFAALVLLVATGVLMEYVLPPGSGHFATLLGLDRHGWGALHFWVSVAFLGTLSLHLLLHWKWIVCMIQGKRGEASGGRFALAVVGLLALAGLVAAPLVLPVERAERPGPGRRGEQQPAEPGEWIKGSSTLRGVAEAAGVPVEQLISRLGLPPGVDPGEQLGRLARAHGFSVADVRRAVAGLQPE